MAITDKRATPELRFKDFNENWRKNYLKDILSIKSGLGFKASEYTTNKGIKLLQIENVSHGAVKWTNNVKFVPKNYLEIHKDLVLKENDIVLALNRPVTNNKLKIAKLSKADNPSILYQRVGKIILTNEGVLDEFIYQYFHLYLKNYVLKSSIGSDQPFISITNLYKQSIRLPSIQEQKKIACFLVTVDDKIKKLTQKYELLTQYKKGIMQRLFSQKLCFSNDKGNHFEKWKEVKLSNFAIVNPKTNILPNKFIYIDLESVSKGKLLSKNTMNLENAPIRAQRLLQNNDIIFQMVRPYQKNNYFFTNKDLNSEYVASTGYAQFRVKDNNSKYLYYVLHTTKFVNDVLKRCTGTSYPAINSSDLSDIKVPKPTLEEQTKIASFLTTIDENIDQTYKQLVLTKQWKKGLLQQMFL